MTRSNPHIDTRARLYLSSFIGIGGSTRLALTRGKAWAERQPEGNERALSALADAAYNFGCDQLSIDFADARDE